MKKLLKFHTEVGQKTCLTMHCIKHEKTPGSSILILFIQQVMKKIQSGKFDLGNKLRVLVKGCLFICLHFKKDKHCTMHRYKSALAVTSIVQH